METYTKLAIYTDSGNDSCVFHTETLKEARGQEVRGTEGDGEGKK